MTQEKLLKAGSGVDEKDTGYDVLTWAVGFIEGADNYAGRDPSYTELDTLKFPCHSKHTVDDDKGSASLYVSLKRRSGNSGLNGIRKIT